MLPVSRERWSEPSVVGTAVAAGAIVAVGSRVAIDAEVAVGLGSVVVETAGTQAESRSEPARRAASR